MSSSAARREAADAFIGSGGPAKRPGFAERRRLARARGTSSARQKTADALLASPEAAAARQKTAEVLLSTPEAEGTCWVMTTAESGLKIAGSSACISGGARVARRSFPCMPSISGGVHAPLSHAWGGVMPHCAQHVRTAGM